MKKYIRPEMEIIKLETEDIITTSSGGCTGVVPGHSFHSGVVIGPGGETDTIPIETAPCGAQWDSDIEID